MFFFIFTPFGFIARIFSKDLKKISGKKDKKLLSSFISYDKKNNYDANIYKAQERIEKILGLKVSIVNKKNNSGKIIIDYSDLEQFEFLSELLTKR